MKVKNFGTTPISIVVDSVRYQFAADQVLVFDDKNELLVDAAIKIYPDLKVIYENAEEEILTDDEIADAVTAHNNDLAAHSGVISGAIGDHVGEADPHTQYQKESEKNQPLGYAGLDGGGKVSITALPNSVMSFNDFWNASTNTPALVDGVGNAGDVYQVSVAGTQNLGSGSQSFDVGDWVVYTGGGLWIKSLNSAAAIPDASDVTAGKVNITAQTFGGHKTFKDGLTSQEEIIISSTLNPYASVRTASVSGNSTDIIISSGNSSLGSSGTSTLKAGDAAVSPSTVTMQGISYTSLAVGSEANLYSVQNIIDTTFTPITSGFAYTGNTTNGSNQISGMSSTVGLVVGMRIIGTGIPANATVIQIISATDIRISANATATASGVSLSFVNALNFSNVYLITNYAAGDDFTNVSTYTRTGCTTTTASDIVGVTSQFGFVVGMAISGTGIPANTTVIAILSPTTIQISNPATATGTVTLTFIYATNATGAIFRATGSIPTVWSNGSTLQPILPQGLGNRILNRIPAGLTSEQLHTAQRAAYFILHDFDTALTTSAVTQIAETQYLSGALKVGDTVVGGNQVTAWTNVQTPFINLATATASNQVFIRTQQVVSGNSAQLLIGSGATGGTGNTGALNLFSSTPNGSGASGVVNISSGGVRGTLASGAVNLVSGSTQPLSTANSGGINIISGNINGLSGNSGNVFVGSGAYASTTVSGTVGQVQIFTGAYAGNGSVSGGLLFVGGGAFSGAGSGTTSALSMRSGDKTNAAATGSTGTLTVRSGFHSGIAGSTGSALFSTGDMSGVNIGGTTGTLTVRSGNISNAGATGSTGFLAMVSGDNSGSGNTGYLDIRSGQIFGSGSSGQSIFSSGAVNSGSGLSGFVSLASGNTVDGASGALLITSGTINGTAAVTSGQVTLSSGGMTNGAATASTGLVQIFSGNVSAGSGNSGNVNIYSGNAVNGNSGSLSLYSNSVSGSGNSGFTLLETGATQTGTSGNLGLTTGWTASGNSGQLTLRTGTVYGGGAGNTGSIELNSGAVSNGASGNVNIYSGAHAGVSGAGTAQVSIRSGFIQGALLGGTSGNLTFETGAVQNAGSTANSGNITISTGTVAGSGARGNVIISSNVVSVNANDNINLVHGATSKAVYIAGSSYGLYLQTQDIGSFAGYTAHSTIGMSNFQNKVNLLVQAGSDSVSVGAGTLLLGGGFASNGANNGGSVEIHSGGHTSTGNGGNIKLVLNGATKGKIYLQDGSEGTVGHVWTQTHSDGRGAWQAASGGASLGNLEVANTTLRPVATGADIRITTKDSGGFTGNVYVNTGFQSSGGNSGSVEVYSGGSNGSTGGVNIYTSAAGSTFNSGSVTITTGATSGGGVRGKIKLQDGTQGTVGHVWTQTSSDGTGSWQAVSGGAGWTTSVRTTTYTAVNNDEILADSSGGAFTVNLPASPSVGQRVRFVDYGGTWNTNNVTVGRNGSNIQGAAANFALQVSNGWAEFVYSGASRGWLVIVP